jgi:hypothetical protein
MFHRRRLLILWTAIALLAGPARAQESPAEPDPDQRPAEELIIEDNAKHKAAELAVYARIGSHGAFGPGVQLAVPVAPRGFLDSINEAFFVEFGVDFMWSGLILPGFDSSPYLVVAPMGGVKWVFYITPAFEAFTSIKGGAYVSTDTTQLGALSTPLFEWTFGGHVRLSQQFAIRFEVGYPAVRIGLQIAFE